MVPYKEKQMRNPSCVEKWEVLRENQEGIELEMKSLEKKLESKICQ
jgi:hypothetical protein